MYFSGLITRLKNAPSCLEPNGHQPTPHLFSNSRWEMRISDFQMIQELGSGKLVFAEFMAESILELN